MVNLALLRDTLLQVVNLVGVRDRPHLFELCTKQNPSAMGQEHGVTRVEPLRLSLHRKEEVIVAFDFEIFKSRQRSYDVNAKLSSASA